MPQPDSTVTSNPAFVSFFTVAGTSAARRSPGKVSFGTPKSMQLPLLNARWCIAQNATM
jgi:hypothetical protein